MREVYIELEVQDRVRCRSGVGKLRIGAKANMLLRGTGFRVVSRVS